MTRQLIVVDIETTNLDPNTGAILEVCALNMDTDEELYFVPFITPVALGNADGIAMQINRYYERGVWRDMLKDIEATRDSYMKLAKMLKGNTFAGMNPTFDVGFLSQVMPPSWHYAPADVGAYVAGSIGMHPAEVPNLTDLAHRFGLDASDAHGARGDVNLTAELYKATMRLRGDV